MRRRLLLLNLVLLALIGMAAHRLYLDVLAAKQTRETWRRQWIQPATAAPPAPAAPPQPVTGAQYLDVAQQVLFYRDRNPQVILEAEKPKEKPLPPLPVYFGSMNLGEGPILVMAEKSDARQRSYQVGQKIGEYQIAQLETDGLVLQFEERKVRKTFEELRPRADQVQASAQPRAQVQVQAPGPALPPKPVVKDVGPTPGTEMAPGLKACVVGDSSPPGTVQDGYRKMVTQTPFGASCRWEKI